MKNIDIEGKVNFDASGAQKAFADLSKHLSKLDQDNSKMLSGMNKLDTSVRTLKTSFLGLASSVTAMFGLRTLADYAAKTNKTLYDMSRASKLTGASLGELTQGIKKLHDTTQLSNQEATDFFQTVQKGTVGIKLTSSAVAELGATLSGEFGPSLEDVSDAFNKLSSIQQKNVHLFRVLQKSTDDASLFRYANGLVLTNNLSEEQLNVLTRTIRARNDEGRGISEAEKKLIAHQKAMKELDKAMDDIKLTIGQALIPAIKAISPYIQDAVNWVKNFIESLGPDKLGRIIVMLGKVAAGFVAIKLAMKAMDIAAAIGGRVAGAGRSVVGMLGGGRAGGLLPALGGAGVAKVFVTNFPTDMGGGMRGSTIGSGGGMLGRMAGRGLRAAPWALAGLAVEHLGAMGGNSLKEAGYNRAGAGAKAATGIGGMALQGGAAGFTVGGPWGAAIGAVGGAIVGVIKNFDDLKTALSGLGGWLKNVISTAAEFWNLGAAWTALKNVLKSVGDFIIGPYKAIWNMLSGVFSSIYGPISKIIGALGDFISVLMVPFKAAWMGITGVLMGVANYVAAPFKAAWEGIKKVMSSVIGYVTAPFKAAWDGIKTVLGGVADSIKKAFGSVIDYLKSKFGKIWDLVAGEGPMMGGTTDAQKQQEAKTKAIREGMKQSPTGASYEEGLKSRNAAVATAAVAGTGIPSASEKQDEAKAKLDKEAGGDITNLSNLLRLGVSGVASSRLQKGVGGAAPMSAAAAQEEVAGGGLKGFKAAMGVTPEQVKAQIKARLSGLDLGEDVKKSIEANLSQIDVKKLKVELGAQGLEAFVKFKMDMEATSSLIEGMNQNLSVQADYMAQYEGNVAGANALLEKQLQNLGDQMELTKRILETSELTTHVHSDLNDIDGSRKALFNELARLQKDGADASGTEVTAVRQQLAGLLQYEGQYANLQKQRIDTGIKMIDNSMVQANLMGKEVGLMEAQMDLFTKMNMGLGPTLEMQTSLVNKLDEQKRQLRESLDLTRKQIAEAQKSGRDVLPLRQKALEIEGQITAASAKQVELTKTLREGYLDAMQVFTNAEGTFSKMITSKEMGTAEMMRTLGSAGGARLGQIGAGGGAPVAQWGAGGSLQFKGDWNKLNKQYGVDYGAPQMLQPNAAGAIQQSGAGQFYGGQDKSVFSGNAGGLTTGQAKRMGDLQQALITSPGDKGIQKELGQLQATASSGDPVIAAINAVEKAIRECCSGVRTQEQAKANAEAQGKVDDKTQGKLVNELKKGADVAGSTDVLKGTNDAKIGSSKKIQAALEAADQADLNKWDKYFQETEGMPGVNTSGAGFGRGATGAIGVRGTTGAAAGTVMNVAEERQHQNDMDARRSKDAQVQKIMEGGNVPQKLAELMASGYKEESEKQIKATNDVEKATNDVVKAQNEGSARVADSVSGATAENAIVSAVCPIGKQTGGWVPGMGIGDVMPAMLEPGEFVMNKKASAAFAPLLDAMNVGKFQDGGFAGVAPSAGLAMASGGGVGSPRFNISVRGDTKRNIMNNVNKQLGDILSDMMTTNGTTGRYYDLQKA